jgi:Animal haem peroxidase
MPMITRPHSLFRLGAAALQPDTASNSASQSRYCYRFPELAEDSRAGCFQGTTAAETFDRLKAFEKATRTPMSDMPVLRMQLAAVYTYFGQFVNHDISAPVGDVVTRPDLPEPVEIIGAVDPAGLDRRRRGSVPVILDEFRNEQPDPLSLDSLYGEGPQSADSGIRALYEADGMRFRIGKTRTEDEQVFRDAGHDLDLVVHATDAPDILRQDGQPLIADRRNDENLIISQLHLAFLLFHNKAVDALQDQFPGDAPGCFAAARQLVLLHYHWLILHDFLDKLLSPEVLKTPLSARPQTLPDPKTVPLEFTTAAFRFGHSMVGSSYDFNANFGTGSLLKEDVATLQDLFKFTTQRNMGSDSDATLQLPDHWVIDWARMSRPPGADGTSGAEKIDLTFASDMLNAMGASEVAAHGSILFRNIMRGFHRRIPFGQVLAQAYGVKVLSRTDIRKAFPSGRIDGRGTQTLRDFATENGLAQETPAWLYFLCEARIREKGERIGATASHLIADTITGLMRHMPTSVLNHQGGTWHPRDSLLKAGPEGLTTIGDLLLYAVKGTKAEVAPA